MKQFDYTIMDALGIHARPAGQITKMAKGFSGTVVTITKGTKTVKASQLMGLMGMAVKKGDTVTVAVEGDNEDEVFATVKEFFENNL